MSTHSYSKCWIHLIWGTYDHKKTLSKDVRIKISQFLYEYSKSKNIHMKTNYVNPDHVHVLIDLPTDIPIEKAAKLLKGASSFWINKNKLTVKKFIWSRGYGAFSVSESMIKNVVKYINEQETHHQKRAFLEEYKDFIKAYKMKYEENN